MANFSKYAHLCFVCSSLSYHNDNEVKKTKMRKKATFKNSDHARL